MTNICNAIKHFTYCITSHIHVNNTGCCIIIIISLKNNIDTSCTSCLWSYCSIASNCNNTFWIYGKAICQSADGISFGIFSNNIEFFCHIWISLSSLIELADKVMSFFVFASLL